LSLSLQTVNDLNSGKRTELPEGAQEYKGDLKWTPDADDHSPEAEAARKAKPEL